MPRRKKRPSKGAGIGAKVKVLGLGAGVGVESKGFVQPTAEEKKEETHADRVIAYAVQQKWVDHDRLVASIVSQGGVWQFAHTEVEDWKQLLKVYIGATKEEFSSRWLHVLDITDNQMAYRYVDAANAAAIGCGYVGTFLGGLRIGLHPRDLSGGAHLLCVDTRQSTLDKLTRGFKQRICVCKAADMVDVRTKLKVDKPDLITTSFVVGKLALVMQDVVTLTRKQVYYNALEFQQAHPECKLEFSWDKTDPFHKVWKDANQLTKRRGLTIDKLSEKYATIDIADNIKQFAGSRGYGRRNLK
jgi:hypothetical protein